jgi:hypothetical protein
VNIRSNESCKVCSEDLESGVYLAARVNNFARNVFAFTVAISPQYQPLAFFSFSVQRLFNIFVLLRSAKTG